MRVTVSVSNAGSLKSGHENPTPRAPTSRANRCALDASGDDAKPWRYMTDATGDINRIMVGLGVVRLVPVVRVVYWSDALAAQSQPERQSRAQVRPWSGGHRSSVARPHRADAPLQHRLRLLQRVRQGLAAGAARGHGEAGREARVARRVGHRVQRWRA